MPKEYNFVHNNSDMEYNRVVKGKRYVIPAHGKIKITRRERVDLLSQFTGMTMDDRGPQDVCAQPLSWSMAEDVVIEEVVKPTCMTCGSQFDTDKELSEHIKKHEGMPAAVKPES